MAVKKNEMKSAAEKTVKKTADVQEKAVKADAKKSEVKADKAVKEDKAEKKAEKSVKEEKPAKKAAAKKPAKKAAKAASEIYFEFAGKQIRADEITKAVEAACKADGKKSTGVKIYVKAEDSAVYYVAQDGETGKLDL